MGYRIKVKRERQYGFADYIARLLGYIYIRRIYASILGHGNMWVKKFEGIMCLCLFFQNLLGHTLENSVFASTYLWTFHKVS